MTNNNKKVDIDDELNWQDTLQVQGVMAKGYGITPKMVMLDRRLTIEAKSIYSYFCSYAGAGTTAFPSRTKIMKDLDIGKDRYYKHFNLLKETGYIEVAQARKGQGLFKSNIYTLVPNPKPLSPDKTTDNLPCPDFRDTGKTDPKSPCPCFTDTGNRDTGNKDTIINSSSNIINNSIYNQSIYQKMEKNNDRLMDKKHKDKIELYEKTIKENVNYEHLKNNTRHSKEDIDNLVNLIIDICVQETGTVNINKNQIPVEIVKSKFFKITSEHIEYILESLNNNPSDIKNIRNYLLTTIYNSVHTIDQYYRGRVNHDMSEYGKYG